MERSRSPSSSRLAYVYENGQDPTIYVANTDGSNPVKLSSVPGDEVGDWSHDGNSVVFVVRDVNGQGLYLRNPDGVNERRLTDTPDYGPGFSHLNPQAFLRLVRLDVKLHDTRSAVRGPHPEDPLLGRQVRRCDLADL